MEKKPKNILLKTYYNKKKVLVIGDAIIKGTWLSLILKSLGANVYGIGINKKEYVFSNLIKLKKIINYKNLNINHHKQLEKYIRNIDPDIIFHLASESLVADCNLDPKNAFDTNVIGLVNLLNIFKIKKKRKKLIIFFFLNKKKEKKIF